MVSGIQSWICQIFWVEKNSTKEKGKADPMKLAGRAVWGRAALLCPSGQQWQRVDYRHSPAWEGCWRELVTTAGKETVLKFCCELGGDVPVAEGGQERGNAFGLISELPGQACTLPGDLHPFTVLWGTAGSAGSCLFLAPFFFLLISLKRRKGHNSLSSQKKAH